MKLKHEGRTYRFRPALGKPHSCEGCAFNRDDIECEHPKIGTEMGNACLHRDPSIWRETFLSRLVRAYREEIEANDHAADRYAQ